MEGIGSSSDARSNLDPSLATPSKEQLKKQRKRDRKHAKWLAANPESTQDGEFEDPSAAKSEESAIPTGSERLDDSNVAKHDTSADTDEREHHLDHPVVAEPDRSDSASEYASVQSEDTDSQAEFHTPPESSSTVDVAHQGLPIDTSDLPSSEETFHVSCNKSDN